jgi:pyruvate dehydrogenase E2 component (dihydrolipoamide acetyltransferase)
MSTVDVTLPQLSDVMEEGTLAEWLLSDGDDVEVGAPLVEIETDKASMVYEAECSGTLQIVVVAGETVAVGTVIARVGDPAAPAAAVPATPVPAPPASVTPVPAPADGRLRVSPVARRMARERGVDLSQISGTGPSGRITKADVVAAPTATAPAASAPAPVASVPSPTADPERVALTRTQALIARRMVEAKSTIPEFTVTTDVDMTAAIALRGRLRAALPVDRRPPSYNDFIIKACGVALREHPLANGSFVDGQFELHAGVHVGMAVAAGDDLVVPTIRDADSKSLIAIAADTRALAERVRDRTVAPAELTGATFTVSNLGMFGVTHFTAVVNPPQAAILAVGSLGHAIFDRDGEPVIRPSITLTLSCDHRILYGAHAARFLRDIRHGLEHPELLLVS